MEKQLSTTPKLLGGITGKGFMPGQSGNPKGRRKKTKLEKFTERVTKESVMKFLEENALGAAKRVKELSREAKNERVKLSANQDILDRVGVLGKGQGGQPIQLNQIILKINAILEEK